MFEKEQEQIISSLKEGQSAQSWIIIGPKGIGKESFAKNLVTRLTHVFTEYNGAVKWVSCGLTEAAKSEIQKSILAGKSLEEKNWSKKTHITVDDVREGCKFLSLKSDKIRFLIFNLADDMNENAQNALLKTLEEPYPNSLILLLCENLGHLLPTILSRCQKIYLTAPNVDDFKALMKKKKSDLSEAELDELAFLSSNSVGLAEHILKTNGLAIYHRLLELLLGSELVFNDLLAFAEEVSKDNEAYLLAQDFILKQLAFYAREEASQNLENAYKKSTLYMEIKKLFQQVENINLDKKQTLISVIHQIKESL